MQSIAIFSPSGLYFTTYGTVQHSTTSYLPTCQPVSQLAIPLQKRGVNTLLELHRQASRRLRDGRGRAERPRPRTRFAILRTGVSATIGGGTKREPKADSARGVGCQRDSVKGRPFHVVSVLLPLRFLLSLAFLFSVRILQIADEVRCLRLVSLRRLWTSSLSDRSQVNRVHPHMHRRSVHIRVRPSHGCLGNGYKSGASRTLPKNSPSSQHTPERVPFHFGLFLYVAHDTPSCSACSIWESINRFEKTDVPGVSIADVRFCPVEGIPWLGFLVRGSSVCPEGSRCCEEMRVVAPCALTWVTAAG